MAAHIVLGQGIHLRTIENFLAVLNLAFQPFDIERDILWQFYALKQLLRPVDEYISEFRVFVTSTEWSRPEWSGITPEWVI